MLRRVLALHQSQRQAQIKVRRIRESRPEVKTIIEARLKLGQPLPKEEAPTPELCTFPTRKSAPQTQLGLDRTVVFGLSEISL
jgi:hypothetical protein